MSEAVAVWDGSRWVSIQGGRGEAGRTLSIKGTKATVADLPTPGVEGDLWLVAGDGYTWDAAATPPAYASVGRIQGPAGPQGSKGDKGLDGAPGINGASATVAIGTVTTGAAGSAARVTNTGTASAAVLSFQIPAGDVGPVGPIGPAPTLSVVSTTDTANGNPATATIALTGAGSYGLSFVIPQGARGAAGASVTFRGVASSWPPTTPAQGDLWQIGTPAPAGAPAPAGHMVAYDGTAWRDGGMIKGDKGDSGPTAISVDAGNVARLGADGLLFVPAGATPIATKTTLGGVIVGTGLTVDAAGNLAADATKVDPATTTTAGTVTLADANAITNKDGTKVVTAAQLVGQVEVKAPLASPAFTGQVTLAAGTAAAPSLTFKGDPDSGLYHVGQDKVEFVTGGAPVMQLGTKMVTFPEAVTIGTGATSYKLPASSRGAAGDVLTSDGAGNSSWAAVPQAVSTDAGNLTKLGTDGKVYTAVKASDVTGLGTIATKSANDYLPTGGGVLQGPVGLTSLTGPSAYLAADVADTAEVQIVANGRDAFLELTTKTTGGIEAGWQLRADANGLLTTQAVSGAAGANGTTPLSLNFAAYNATLGDRVTVGFPAFLERNVTVQNTAGNSSVFTIAAPTGVDASFRLVANKSGVPSIEWRTAGEDWVVSAQVNNQLLIGTTTQPGGIGLMRTSTDTDATARITLGWGTNLTGSVMTGVKFGATSASGDRLDAYEEGNWVPAFTADTPPSLPFRARSGQYTRIGRQVTVTGYIQAGSIVSTFSSVGDLRISGLPFPRQTGSIGGGSVGLANGWGTARPAGLFADGTLGANEIGIYDSAAHTGTALPLLTVDKMSSDCLLMFQFTYFTTT
jgi:hypothetical protein